VQGTVGVLEAALESPTVQAIAITSSIGSAFDPKFGWRPGYTYTAVCVASFCDRKSEANYAFVRQDDFNPTTFEEAASPDFDVNSYGEPWRPYIMYCASKGIAERAAWVC
jgi:nucleoside-diphosphate-sugar epimerase